MWFETGFASWMYLLSNSFLLGTECCSYGEDGRAVHAVLSEVAAASLSVVLKMSIESR